MNIHCKLGTTGGKRHGFAPEMHLVLLSKQCETREVKSGRYGAQVIVRISDSQKAKVCDGPGGLG